APFRAACLSTDGPTSSSGSPLRRLKNQANRLRESLPILRLGLQVGSTFAGQAIKLRIPTGVRRFPLGCEQASVFEAMQRRVQGALLYLQDVPRNVLNSLGYRVAVNRTECDDTEDQEVQRALWQVRFRGVHA